MSSKPCPGCGEVNRHRKADELCWECKETLKFAKKLQEEFALVPDNKTVVVYGERPYWNGYFYCHDAKGDCGRLLQQVFLDLVKSIVVPYTGSTEKVTLLLGKIDGLGQRGMMSTRTAEAIVALHKAIQPVLDAVYEAGKKDGSNLLMRLATGDIATNEFLEETKR